jgi:hypothetical protein
MFRIITLLTCILSVAACTSIPITSLYKLYKFDIFEASPDEFRIAIRTHEYMLIKKGSVVLKIGFTAEDDSLIIDDTYFVEIERNGVLTGELLDDKAPNESVTIMQFSPDDAKQFATTLRLISNYREASGKEGRRSTVDFNIDGLCVTQPLPDGKIPMDVLLQSTFEDGYFVFLNNVDARKERKDFDSTIDDVPLCQDQAE